MQNLIFVDFKTATTPTSGECLVERYWTVDPARGLAFMLVPGDQRPYPQCNPSQVVAEYLQQHLFPDLEVRKIPLVFMRHADRLASRVLEARRVLALARTS